MLRKRKNRRYNETNDEEGDGERKFDLIAQIKAERFDQIREKHLQELPGEAITLRFIQKHGFEKPILVEEPEGLNLRVPPKTFLVRDVRNCVGHQRIIDVMDVKTQKNIEMSMKDWCKYYESKNKDRLLNVISLEFSHTAMDELVESPMIVKLLDWVDLVWPKFLKESQTESTNTINKMKYPKVQKYCLMSVKGSYTDFHIDFGGTSVWYHILRGKKIFWMVPPTELNLQIFEEWTLSGMQQDVFFGDTVEECFRVELKAGNTFFIPSGWIHAVYTLEDSLVFGGNFLHSFGIENQLKVSRIEDATKVPIKFRYPFYTEILWYVVQHYVHCLTEKNHLQMPATPPAVKPSISSQQSSSSNNNSNCAGIEDETTESEQEESDNATNKKRKTSAASSSKRKGGRPTKGAQKKTRKKAPTPSTTDDDSTDIDSANEHESSKPAPKVASNTCRMTKNSLLRLQYDIEEQQLTPTKTCNKQPEKVGSPNKSQVKRKAETSPSTVVTPPKTAQKQDHRPPKSTPTTSASSTTLNLADIVLSHESKLNGWSSGTGGQSTWSNPNLESKEPRKIHITKYELNGLKVLVKHLSKLSGAKKNLPNLIRNSRALLDDCRKLIAEHENDDPELAITGRPITPEILSTVKKTDMNELIGQFFKPPELTTANDESSSSNTKSSASRVEATSTSAQQRLKTSHSSEGAATAGAIKAGDEKKISISTDNSTSVSPSKSPHKETKCLTPNKKLSTSASSTSSSLASPPQRPKSPPTRPLSNNQYTSKTKNNNNLLLPGSFADLIAATSTEKKVFDVTGSDLASSLFGIKDLASAKPSSSTSSSTSSSPHPTKAVKSEKDKYAAGQLNSKSSSTSNSKSIDVLSTAVSVGAGASSSSTAKEQPTKANSPEPPKVTPQKRFITPTSFRPHNKEKLIYASAPYISPVHASEQSKSTNQLYPWQLASPMPSSYSPRPPSTTHSSVPTTPTVAVTQATYGCTPDSRSTIALSNLKPGHTQNKPASQERSTIQMASQRVAESAAHQNQHQVSNRDNSQVNVLVKPIQAQKQAFISDGKGSSERNPIVNEASAYKQPESKPETYATSKSTPSEVAHQQTNDESEDLKVKPKPNKPRGPPKKSKEARQVIESSPETIKPSIPVSVIKVGPSSSSSDPVPSAPKPKPKRSKKQKDDEPGSAPSSSAAALPNLKATTTTTTASSIRPQTQPSVICGFVAPPTSTSAPGAKFNPQSYLLSRPLLFNTMPNFSAAQLQHIPRAAMPLLTTPVGSPLGLPFQQGARIVWATPPQRLPTPVKNNLAPNTLPQVPQASSATAKNLAKNSATTVTSQSDNAALLSLATTALSTAPMVSSPALSQLSTRATTPQAIMVSSAGTTNQALFAAGQQFFRPLVQRMPAHFVTQPTGPRPTNQQLSQLVFARLPNQSQPRYLITQPGFMQQRFPTAPHIMTSQPTPTTPTTLAFATFKPSHTDSTKTMKNKKVKTS